VPGLDNPIWTSLTTVHAYVAEGDDRVRRYPAAIGPLTGMRDQRPETYDALRQLLAPDQVAVLFLDAPPALPPGWSLVRHAMMAQMVCTDPVPVEHVYAIEPLGTTALAEMIALTALTEPGPFGPRTLELGTFVGVYASRRLAAMAGERLHLPGYTEVSAVCTHPDHRGHGYASALVSAVVNAMRAKGETPMLHVRANNTSAIRVYERLGFTTRRSLDLAVVQPSSQSSRP
jgi:ribosomal protein S18 acetylase RimI-like enzyme